MKKSTLITVLILGIGHLTSFAQNWADVSQNFYQSIGAASSYQFNPLTGLWDQTGSTLSNFLNNTDAGTAQEIMNGFGGLRQTWLADSSAMESGINAVNANVINPVTVSLVRPNEPSMDETASLRGISQNILQVDPNNPTRSVWNAVKANMPALITVGSCVQIPLDAAYYGDVLNGTTVGIFGEAQPDISRPLSVGFSGAVLGQYTGAQTVPGTVSPETLIDEGLQTAAQVTLFSAHGHFGVYKGFAIPAFGRFFRGYIGGGSVAGTYFPAHATEQNPNNVGKTTGLAGFAEAGLQARMGPGSIRSGLRVGVGQVFNNPNAKYESRDLFLTYTVGRVEISSRASYEMWGPNKGGLFLCTQFGYIISSRALN